MKRELPFANSLRHAVETVFDSNRKDGYTAKYFVDLLNLDNEELKHRVENWMSDDQQRGRIASILYEHKSKKLLTLEDLIVHFDLGLSCKSIESARERVEMFDSFRGFKWVKSEQ